MANQHFVRRGHAKGFNAPKIEAALLSGDFIGASFALHDGIGGKVGRRSRARAVVAKLLRAGNDLPVPNLIEEDIMESDAFDETTTLVDEVTPVGQPFMREVVVRPVADAGQVEQPFVMSIPVPERNLPA